ncbi:MAG: hypothetical protein CL578_05800 [Alteromonadaceae bacterium]|uniref:hypothetical protein n=1 Tax=uncultured Paraglaciecola sp. TaxID=1765024 RepID=UPI000C5ABA02|nr:hypothetical protein [Alteromonadaceae bacterium]|tara:strand:+ start:19491 stop:19853 length:363 start_codon:yes stop_codon:yes gene_type:complete
MSKLLNPALNTANDLEALAVKIKNHEQLPIDAENHSGDLSWLTTIFIFGQLQNQHAQFLSDCCRLPIIVRDAESKQVFKFDPPQNGWTVDDVRRLQIANSIRENVYDVFLNEVWIGSSEI